MSQEALIDMFSSLSQKRRQGSLRVTMPGGSLNVLLTDGKIIGVLKGDGREAHSVCGRLLRAGVIHDKVYKLFQNTPVGIPQLFDLLVSKKFVRPEQFQKARVAYEMDLLHSLRFADDAQLNFTTGDVRVDPRFPFTLSPGQLLLDIAELNADEERFQRVFSAESSRVSINGKCDRPKGLNQYELAVWESIQSAKKLEQLFQALLSEFEVREGLLALYDQNLVVVSVNGIAVQPVEDHADPSSGDELDDDLAIPDEEEEVDFYGQIATEAVDSLLDGFEDELDLSDFDDEVLEAKPKKSDAGAVSSNAKSAAKPGPRPVAERSVEETPAPTILRSAETFFSNDAARIAAPSGHHEPIQKSSEQKIARQPRRDFSLVVADWNYRLLQPDTLQKIILLTILAYLLTVLFACLFSGSMIDRWFRVLSDFTSNT